MSDVVAAVTTAPSASGPVAPASKGRRGRTAPNALDRDLRAAIDDVYDDYRKARLNVKFYGRKLGRLQATNLVMELSIAVGRSGVIAALAIWKTDQGKFWLALIAAIAAILGV